jgi:hypothetical protein
MSLSGLCTSGPNRKKMIKMDSFEVVKYKGVNRYMARGESTQCQSVLTRVVSKQFALDWSKSTGKPIKEVMPNQNRKRKREAAKQRKRERKARQKK